MRVLTMTAAALLASASTALAAPASVSVTIGPELQAMAEEVYGTRDVQWVADDLRTSVERALARTGAHQDARVELVLTDARPNQPTFKQYGDTLGLSMRSFGTGGAAFEGRIIAADGSETPIAYKWYESDIRQAQYLATWSDAGTAVDRLARRISRGQQLTQR